MILGLDIWAVVYLVAKIILWSDPPAQVAWTSDSFSGLLVQKWSSPDDSWLGQDLVNTETIWTNPCGIIRSNSSVTSGLSRADWELAGRLFRPKWRKSKLKSPSTQISRPDATARSHWSRKDTNLANCEFIVPELLSSPCFVNCHCR